jgi:hypothetical protein
MEQSIDIWCRHTLCHSPPKGWLTEPRCRPGHGRILFTIVKFAGNIICIVGVEYRPALRKNLPGSGADCSRCHRDRPLAETAFPRRQTHTACRSRWRRKLRHVFFAILQTELRQIQRLPIYVSIDFQREQFAETSRVYIFGFERGFIPIRSGTGVVVLRSRKLSRLCQKGLRPEQSQGPVTGMPN